MLTGDLFVFGDVRDVVRESWRGLRGEEVDPLVLTPRQKGHPQQRCVTAQWKKILRVSQVLAEAVAFEIQPAELLREMDTQPAFHRGYLGFGRRRREAPGWENLMQSHSADHICTRNSVLGTRYSQCVASAGGAEPAVGSSPGCTW